MMRDKRVSDLISSIENPRYQELAWNIFDEKVSNVFLTYTASRSGKFHPPDERGVGGLLLHTKRAIKAGDILLKALLPVQKEKYDIQGVRTALLLHDVARPVYPKSHDIVIWEWILERGEEFTGVANMTKRHMGQWGVEVPQTVEDWLVHLSDMVASQYFEEG